MGISSGKGPKVAVLMGGHSLEREVSLISGQACSAALRGKDFEVLELDAGHDVVQRLSELQPDVVSSPNRTQRVHLIQRVIHVSINGPTSSLAVDNFFSLKLE